MSLLKSKEFDLFVHWVPQDSDPHTVAVHILGTQSQRGPAQPWSLKILALKGITAIFVAPFISSRKYSVLLGVTPGCQLPQTLTSLMELQFRRCLNRIGYERFMGNFWRLIKVPGCHKPKYASSSPFSAIFNLGPTDTVLYEVAQW